MTEINHSFVAAGPGSTLDPVLLVDFLDAIPGQVALVDAAGMITAVNPAWREFGAQNGAGARCGVGVSYLSACDGCGDADGQAVADGLKLILAGQSERAERRYPCPTGTERRWFRCLISPLRDSRSGSIRGAMVMHLDVTARQLAEERAQRNADSIRLIADALPALVSYTDKDLVLRFVNRRYEEQYGIPASQLVGRHLSTVFGSKGLDEIADHLRKVLGGEEVEFEGKVAGSRRWFHACLVPHRDDDQIHGYFTLVYDVTAAKETEAALQQARHEAELANHAKSVFLATMSHELRTPLNAVIGFSELLTRQIWGPMGQDRYLDYARDIHMSGIDLLNLINDVLDLSKVEAGKFDLHEDDVVVSEVVESSLHTLSERARQSHVALVNALPDDLPLLRADGRLVRQILLNLLSNAIKFTPEGGSVTTGATRTEAGDLVLTVRDTGVGIAPEDIPRVFEPFGQVDNVMASRHRKDSTGLGLPLSRRFAELHGGSLVMESQLGQGTTVTVTFPAERLGVEGMALPE